MTETYTFSRALHLMRYGGKKMKPLSDAGFSSVCWVYNNEIVYHQEGFEPIIREIIPCYEIMGSWIEVKDA